MFFREVNQSDELVIFKWIQNKELRRMIGTRGEPNIDGHKRWFANKFKDENNIMRIIEVDGKPIGIVGTNTFDLLNCNAEMYLYIGETDVQGKGYGTEVVKEFVNYMFEKYKLRKIVARIFEYNIPSIKLFEKCDFVLEGVQKKQILEDSVNNQFCDLLWYALFNEKG